MQIVWKCPLSDERYLIEKAWERAIIGSCPFHPEGDCGVEKLGSYGRVAPHGIRVARFWCPKARASISLLPSFLAARLSGTLAAVEDVVAKVEQAGSIANAVDAVHPADAADAVGLVCALRSIRRRVRAVHAALLAIATLIPERFAGVQATVTAFREALGCDAVLVALRDVAARHLAALAAPLGFRGRRDG
jgi:hypothetical protein